jgi:hypothetical protein
MIAKLPTIFLTNGARRPSKSGRSRMKNQLNESNQMVTHCITIPKSMQRSKQGDLTSWISRDCPVFGRSVPRTVRTTVIRDNVRVSRIEIM